MKHTKIYIFTFLLCCTVPLYVSGWKEWGLEQRKLKQGELEPWEFKPWKFSEISGEEPLKSVVSQTPRSESPNSFSSDDQSSSYSLFDPEEVVVVMAANPETSEDTTSEDTTFIDIGDDEFRVEHRKRTISPGTPTARPKTPIINQKHDINNISLSEWIERCLDTLPNVNEKGKENSRDALFTSSAFSNKYNNVRHFLSKKERREAFENIFKPILVQWCAMRCNKLFQASWQFNNKPNQSFFQTSWQFDKKPDESFFDHLNLRHFQPFAQKIIVPTDTIFYIRGDLHGDIRSIVQQLQQLYTEGFLDNNFKIIQPNTYIMFLGDYVDRGHYGCEVIYTLLRLSLANPDHVILVRGNHEDIKMSERHGFKDEVREKFNDDAFNSIHKAISRIYDLMPCVVYIGCIDTSNGITNYAQCCHGGLEVGYDPKPFLDNHTTQYEFINELNRFTFAEKSNLRFYPKKITQQKFSYFNQDHIILNEPSDQYTELGFMWNDFEVDDNEPLQSLDSNYLDLIMNDRGSLTFGHKETKKILNAQSSNRSKIITIFRAHQHSLDRADTLMLELINNNGIYSMWDSNTEKIDIGSVYTFNVGADTTYNIPRSFNDQPHQFNNAYARVIFKNNPNDWTLHRINLNPIGELISLIAPITIKHKISQNKQDLSQTDFQKTILGSTDTQTFDFKAKHWDKW